MIIPCVHIEHEEILHTCNTLHLYRYLYYNLYNHALFYLEVQHLQKNFPLDGKINRMKMLLIREAGHQEQKLNISEQKSSICVCCHSQKNRCNAFVIGVFSHIRHLGLTSPPTYLTSSPQEPPPIQITIYSSRLD